jgi:iron(III) transport system permease protein
LRLVEPELEEQAMLDGTHWQVFRYATLPNMWGAVALAALWVTMQTAGEMTVTDFFAVRTLAENTYTTIVAGDNPAASLRAMLPVTLLVAAGLAAALRLVALRSNDRPLSMRRELIFAAGPWRWPLAMVLASVLLLIVGVPLGNLICKAGWKVVAMGPERVRYWSLEKCLTMIVDAPSRCPHEIFWTFVICVSAASTAVVIGGAVTWFARLNAVMRWPLAVFTGLGLALPGPMLGLAIVFMLNRPELPWLADLNDHSILAPWLALTVRATPPALVLLWHAWATLPDDVLAAAALDSAGPVRQFMAVAVPQRWPAIAAAWLLAFAMAMGDLAAGILVVPPGVTTLAIHIFQLLHFGVEDQVAGLCLAMLLFFTSIGLVVRWLFASKIGRS